MMISKKLGSKGAVTIPQQLRHEAGLQPGAPLDLAYDPDQDHLIVRKHVPSCSFCGGVQDVVAIEGIEICAACARKLADAAAAIAEEGNEDE